MGGKNADRRQEQRRLYAREKTKKNIEHKFDLGLCNSEEGREIEKQQRGQKKPE
jgi:hypothetical protein